MAKRTDMDSKPVKLPKQERIPEPEKRSARYERFTDEELLAGKTLSRAIEELWLKSDRELADRCEFTPNNLSIMKNGFARTNKSAKRVALTLGIEFEPLFSGKIVKLSQPTTAEPEIVILARLLAGSKHESASVAMMRHLLGIQAESGSD